MRNFGFNEQFADIKKAAVQTVEKIFPVVGRRRTLVLNNVSVEDTLDPTDYKAQAAAKAKDQTWGVNVVADLTLKDNATGETIDQARKVKLFTLPKLTTRFSYIVKGNEYQVSNQLRLKSGVYTLRRQNGELKTQVNLSKGKNFDLIFNEETGQFFMTAVGGTTSKIPLYPVLTYLGVSPSMIERAWGGHVAAANRSSDAKVVEKLAGALKLRPGVTVKDYFQKTELGTETTKIVLGEAYDKVDGPMLLAASKNLLDVQHGKKEPVDRDSLKFKELHSVEDFLSERLEKSAQQLAYKIQRGINSDRRVKISQIVNPGAFSSTIESFFTQDERSATPEQTNPLEMLTGQYEATIMGPGGIGSDHAITPEMRQVHPTHYGFVDPVHTPESKKIGANLHLPIGVAKDGKAMTMAVKDSSGKAHFLTPTQAWEKKVAFPGQTGDTVDALYRGQTVRVKKGDVDYFTPNPAALFSWSTNLVPFLASNQGNRAMMAAKQMEQAISLKHREAPLVQIGGSPDQSMEQLIGGDAAVRAREDGTVKKVASDAITVKHADGERTYNLYNNFTLNRKSFLHHTPAVKVGDKVKAGDLLADSNFTKGGTLALGTNLRIAYLPYKGLNYEDGVVITESAADKLTSEHIHKKELPLDNTVALNLTKFRSTYPTALTPENVRILDDEGVAKKGSKVQQGTVLVAALKERAPNATIALVNKQLSARPRDISLVWPYEDPGTVLDVQRRRDSVTVLVKTEERARIGDKISGRNGNKGIITKIIPDKESPRTKDGAPVQVLLNPHGVIGRINIGQIYESAAGKTALKTGKTHVVRNFSGENYLDTTKALLDKHGVSDKEELFDPETGKSLGRVHVGNPYILKLYKQGTHNFSVRQGGAGNPYDSNHQPLKAGGDEGSKTMDVLTMNTLLAHGARHNLHEMSTYKADQNEEFWRAIKTGAPVPPPKETFAFKKFMNYLKAAGIDVEKNGTQMTLGPLTDKQVEGMSAMEIKSPVFFRAKDAQPIKGGFLDQQQLGGFKGDKWGHIELVQPVVNPVFEDAVKKVTGLGRKYDDLMAGKLFYDKRTGQFNTEGHGLTSGAAVEQLLKKIDVKGEIEALKSKVPSLKANQLDAVNKKLKILGSLDRLNLRPEEAYIRRKVPVIPAQFRPVAANPDDKKVVAANSNYLYQNLGVVNHVAKLPVMALLPETEKAEIRKDLYDRVKAVSGLLDLETRGRVRDGFIAEIKGGHEGQPKEGLFISKLLSKPQDLVGRGTIIPEPDLGIDEMAMPEEMAWKLFDPFVVRELKAHGKSPLQAQQEIDQRTKLARTALGKVMSERHVLLNRAPSLHKFSIMALKPKLTPGRAIKIPPLIIKGYNADFDGDTMTVHVPVTAAANEEAKKMLPSRNLFQPGTGALMATPAWESQTGLFYLSQTDDGRKKINHILPEKYAVTAVLDKKSTGTLLKKMATEMKPDDFAKTLRDLKALGETHAFERGFSLGIGDLKNFGKERDRIVDWAAKKLDAAKSEDEKAKINKEAQNAINAMMAKHLAGTGNSFYDMVAGGGKGSPDQLRSILATPLLVSDARGKIVAKPIKTSYGEGLSIGDYWTSMYGARRGMIDRAIQTSEPGAFSKEISATTLDNVVTAADCGTHKGITLPVTSSDVMGRYLAHDQAGHSRNTPVDQRLVAELQKADVQTLEVRSPLTCKLPRGTCAYCFGHNEHGTLPAIGDNLGAVAGQAISEPLVQMIMRTFHTGGAAGTGASVSGYQRVGQLLRMPKELPGSVPLAPHAGKVTKVEKGLGGGWNVHVGDSKTYVPAGRELRVSVGDVVEKGDQLAHGPVKPQDVAKLRGMRAAQDYLVDQLSSTYRAQDLPIQRKMFETVVRSLANFTQVKNNPKDSPHLPGDIIPWTVANHYNENLDFVAKPEDAVGYALTEDVGSLKRGHIVTESDAKVLKAQGHKEVHAKREALDHTPIIKGMGSVPLTRQDWMAALGFQNLSKALTEGAAQGWKTDVAGTHPIPAFAHGTTFGKGKDGRY